MNTGRLAIGGAFPNAPDGVDPLGFAEGVKLLRVLFDRLLVFRPLLMEVQQGMPVEEAVQHLRFISDPSTKRH